MMYKLVVSLHECNVDGCFNDKRPMHEIHSKVYGSIQEAFDSVDSGKHMFDVYLEIEKDQIEAMRRVEEKIVKDRNDRTKERESGQV